MDKETFDEIINFAIEREKEAAAFYEATSVLVEREELKSTFKEMVKVEQNHRRLLEEISEEKLPEVAIENIPDLKISDYLVEESFSPDLDYQDVLIIAMKREEKSHKFYSDMAANCGDPEIQKLFQVLAQEEAKHKLWLETEYDEHILIED